MIPIYKDDNFYLYEIIEDYKDGESAEEQDEIFHFFCSSIWSSGNKRRTYLKSIKYKVNKDLLSTDLGKVFDTWSAVEYRHYKSMTKDEHWCSLVRQKINNLYTRYFDKEVILEKEYIDLLKTPKRLYYQWLSGVDMDAGTVTEMIDDAIEKSQKVKIRLQREKMSLSWNAYQKIVEAFLRKCFDNCKLIEDYEDSSQIHTNLDFLTEDHFYVGYLCNSLENYVRNYQKEYYHLRRGHGNVYTRCRQCSALIEKTGSRKIYCTECARKKELERYIKYNQKRNHK